MQPLTIVAATEGEEDVQFANMTLESILRDMMALDRQPQRRWADGARLGLDSSTRYPL
jgi:hypothetical protein